MSEIKNVNAMYMGREFNKKGTRTNKETGVEEEWKQFKAKFVIDGWEKPWTFWVFDPLGKSKYRITEIEEGDKFNIGYVEEEIDRLDDAGKKIVIKKLIGIGDERMNTAPTQQEASVSNSNEVSSIPPKVSEFIKKYKTDFAKDKHNVFHFILMYLKHMDEDLTPIMKKLKEEYLASEQEVVVEDI